MKPRLGALAASLLAVAAALAPAGCATLVNEKRLQFRIGQITGFRLAGFDLGVALVGGPLR